MELCGLKGVVKRSNRGFLLTITGIIASKRQFRKNPRKYNTMRKVASNPYHV